MRNAINNADSGLLGAIKVKLKDLWLYAIMVVVFMSLFALAIPYAIWERLKGLLFEKPKEKEQERQEENTTMLHCMKCGNDFEPERIVEDTDDLTSKYDCRKCPKCGSESIISKSIQFMICGPPSIYYTVENLSD